MWVALFWNCSTDKLKVFYASLFASGTFRNESMNMRIPFEIASKGVEYTNETRSKVFPFVHFEKHAEYNISN